MISDVLTKIFSLTGVSFLIAFLATPLLTNFLYRYKLGKNIRSDANTPTFTQLHAKKQGTPTLGGILVWGTTALLATTMWLLDRGFGWTEFHMFNFLTRRETLLPLGALVGAALVGLVDDVLDIYRMGHKGRGIPFRIKIFLYAAVAAVGAWWFYSKLGYNFVYLPFWGNITIGWWFIPFFLAVVVGTSFAVNQTDGLDGLAGGTVLLALFAYAIIAFMQGRYNLASMLGVICGSLLAFLWFNVYPARFFMGDTGSMALGVTLAIVAFLTNRVLLLPIIGIVFVIEAVSTLFQLFWRRAFKKKFFRSAPIHHHFEAIGWPETKVTMRAWILTSVACIIGVILFFLS
jgi:phospho-N-acetylmuramoyl-pentapeptide-transferase